jgi:uncharacterized protein
MERKSSAYYQRRHRERLREQGLQKKELWVLPEYADTLAALERQMRQPRERAGRTENERERGHEYGEATMTAVAMKTVSVAGPMSSPGVSAAGLSPWTARSLCDALTVTAPVREGAITVELIEGAEPGLYITMCDYGDLPLFMAVAGQQIVIEALLWPVAQVRDAANFNEEVLRTHKLFPLSTLGIETIDGESVYIMFGALSASSLLANILFEIETLADNVIHATEAYERHLREAA